MLLTLDKAILAAYSVELEIFTQWMTCIADK